MSKERVTVTVDKAVLEAAEEAVRRGEAASVSAWVNDAALAKAGHDRKLAALKAAIEAYEAEYGVITDEEIRDVERRDRESAAATRAEAARRRGAS